MKDCIEIGSTPVDESCAQVGEEGYGIRARAECKRFIDLLEKTFPNKPEGARFFVKHNHHDFGVYYEVAIQFDDRDEKAMEFAYMVEENAPTKWAD